MVSAPEFFRYTKIDSEYGAGDGDETRDVQLGNFNRIYSSL
jgi:hypothetical protein